MGQSTTVATAFTAIMLIAGVVIIITSTISTFSVITTAVNNLVSRNEIVLNEDLNIDSWKLVDSQTLRMNISNIGETGIATRKLDDVDLIVTYTVLGSENTKWIPYDQAESSERYWKVNRVFFNGDESDQINPIQLTAPVYGVWDPKEILEIQIYLNSTDPTFDYISFSTPSGIIAKSDLTQTSETGVSTIMAGTQSTWVTHNLGRKPDNVQLTPRNQLTNTEFWVNSENSTHFLINIGKNLAGNVSFYWRIE